MAKKVKCIFCEIKSNKAKEHVWPQWLQRHFGIEMDAFRQVHYSLAGINLDERQLNTLSIVLGEVCEKCNGSWMSKLEQDAKPILLKIFQAGLVEEMFLSVDEKDILSRWIYKTAIVYNRSSNYRNLVPPNHFRYLYHNLSVPPNVFIDYACSKTSKLFSALQSQQMFGVTMGIDQSATIDYLKKFYNIVFQINNCLFRVAYIPIPNHSIDLTLKNEMIYRLNDGMPSYISFKKTFDDIIDFETSTCYKYNDVA